MAEPKAPKPVESASAAPGEKRAAVRPSLARAAESGRGDVHVALGNLETARLNLAAAEREGKSDPEAEASAAAAREQLRALGFE